MAKTTSLDADIVRTLHAIAIELERPADALPVGVIVALRALSKAHYGAGMRDALAATGERAITSDFSDETEVTSAHGLRRQLAQR